MTKEITCFEVRLEVDGRIKQISLDTTMPEIFDWNTAVTWAMAFFKVKEPEALQVDLVDVSEYTVQPNSKSGSYIYPASLVVH
tara:strand:+ start:844 stop:1092 length:249 start_codon:yes stop_codon:yes gene_type:complete